jgi:diaminopimelate epimerase
VGAELSRAPALPEGANAHLVAVDGPARLRARTWELGAGATMACGTGAVAIAAVARRLGWVEGDEITVAMPGGELRVSWDARGAARLAGPARRVFEGVLEVPDDWLAGMDAPGSERGRRATPSRSLEPDGS